MEVPPDGPRGRGVPMAHPERIGYDSKENQQAYNSITHGTPDNQIATAKHFMKKGLKGKELHKAVADHHDVIHADVHKQLNHDKKKLHPLHMSFVGEDLDEGQEKGPKQLTNPNKEVMVVKKNKVIVINKKDQDKYLKQGWTLAEEVELDEALQAIVWKTKPPKGTRRVHPRSKWPGMKPDDIAKTWPSGKAGVEEVDLDENRMSQLHQMIKDKKSAEEIAKMMKLDVKTIKALMSSHHPEDIEESAASDARRAMSRDKDFSRRDTADDDTGATDADVKGASKNIIMQLRKAGNRASMGVEFGDGKKVQIPAKMALAVQQKYNSLKKPADKEKFQAQIAKSYKDMLKVLKSGYGEQKESILERMNRKIKENKDG
jgi:hypothetical protein